MGLNFDQWMNFKGKKEFTFTPKNVPLDNIIKSIENDLEMLYTNPKIKALVEETTAGSGIKFDGKNTVIYPQTQNNHFFHFVYPGLFVLLATF